MEQKVVLCGDCTFGTKSGQNSDGKQRYRCGKPKEFLNEELNEFTPIDKSTCPHYVKESIE